MSKAVEGALKIFAVTFLVVTGIGFVTGAYSGLVGLKAIATHTLTMFGASALQIAALSAAGTLVSGLMNKGIDSISQENFGTKVASRSASAPRGIIYGKARTGGTITHLETSGTDNHKLRLAVCIAGHEVESVDEIYFNETKLSYTTSGGWNYVNSKYVNSNNDNKFSVSNSLCRFIIQKGDQTTANTNITSNSAFTTNDKFTDVAYVFFELIFDSEKFGGGVPQIFFTVKGKKVFDPRDSNHTFGDESTYEWSDNPALCALDYITNTTYGLKATSDEILTDSTLGSFKTAANTCETSNTITTATVHGTYNNVTTFSLTNTPMMISRGMIVTGTGVPSGTKVLNRQGQVITVDTAVSLTNSQNISFGEASYTCNGITNMSATGESVLTGILSSCNGKISFINGKFVMFAGANVTPQMTITDDNVIAPIDVKTNLIGDETYNAVKAIFVDANNRYVGSESTTYSDSTLLANDTPTGESSANYRKTMELQLPFTTTDAMAQRIQKAQLRHHRQAIGISLTTNIAYMQLQPFDWVYVTNERLGFTNKVFEVISTKLQETQSEEGETPVLATQLQLKEIDNSVYTFSQSDYIDPTDIIDPPDTGDFTVTAPTNLTLAQNNRIDGAVVKSDIKVTWTNNADDLIAGTEITYKVSTDSDYEGDFVTAKGVSSALIPNVVVGQTYNVKIRHFSANNVYSDYTSVQNITISDASSINPPTSFTATSNKIGIRLRWTNPTNTNLRAIKVYRRTSNTTPTNDTHLVHTLNGEPGAVSRFHQGSMDGLTPGVTYYFWLRAVTHTGIHSNFTTSVNGSFAIFDRLDIGLGNVTNDAQVKSDLSNFSVESDLFEITSNELRGKNPIKNTQISIAKDGSGNLSLNNAGSGNVSLNNSDVGLSNVLNQEQVRVDLANAPNTIKNSQVSISADGTLNNAGGGQVTTTGIGAETPTGAQTKVNSRLSSTEKTRLNAGKTPDDSLDLNNANVDKAHVGLSNVTNDAQIKTDGSNAPNSLKNDQISISKVSGAVRLSGGSSSSADVSFDNSDVGLGNVTNHAQIKTDGSNAPNSLKNNQISLTANAGTVTLNNASTSNNTFTKSSIDLGNVTNDAQIKTDGSNAPNSLKNSQVTLAKDVSGNISLNNAGSGNISLDNSDVGLGNVTNHAQIKTDGSNAPNSLKNNQITLSLSGTTLGLNNAGSGTQTLTKGSVGLSDLNSLESGTGTKLGNIEANATVGAKLGVNLKDSSNNALGDEDVRNSDIRIAKSGQAIQIKKGSTLIDDISIDKSTVGLSDLNSLESGTGTKLGGIATGATNNGSSINSNGQVDSTLALASGGSITVNSKMTIDYTNERILVQD